MKNRKFYQKKRVMIPLTVGFALIFLGIFGAVHSSMYQTTTNAYVDDYYIKITPKISEKIIELNVKNNSIVKKGEILAELDGTKYLNEIKTLENQLEEIQKALKPLKTKNGEVETQTILKDEIEKTRINLDNANNDYVRYKNDFEDGIVTKKDLEKAIQNLEIAQEQYKNAQEKLKIANTESKITKPLQEARLNLYNVTIIAPKNGKITNLSAKQGDVASTETPMLSIIPDECYIIANFKKLPNTNLMVGQKASVKIYSAAQKNFSGKIVEILPPKDKLISTKIKLDESIEKYNIKPNSKAFVKIKAD